MTMMLLFGDWLKVQRRHYFLDLVSAACSLKGFSTEVTTLSNKSNAASELAAYSALVALRGKLRRHMRW